MSTAAEALLARTLAFCQEARAADIRITPSRILDVVRTLPLIDLADEDAYRVALRLNLVGSREEEQRFERVFREFFHGEGGDRPWHNRIRGQSMQGSLGHHFKELDQDVTTAPETFSAEDHSRGLDLAARWDPDAPPLDQIIRELARHLAHRPSRRWQRAPHGRRIDVRQSLAAARAGAPI